MRVQRYGTCFWTGQQADWVVKKLLSYGIKAWREGKDGVEYITTWKRDAVLRQLFKWWNGEHLEWWSYFDYSWRWKPGACVEVMRYGSDVPNPFAFNDEWKQKYRDRHNRRHGR